jgi:hypothetical protein
MEILVDEFGILTKKMAQAHRTIGDCAEVTPVFLLSLPYVPPE